MIAKKQRHFVALMLIVLFILFSSAFYTNFSSSVLQASGTSHGAFENSPFEKIFVHLDLKGAPPKLSFYEPFFTLLKQLGVKGVLIEYEDAFPYYGQLSKLPRDAHYSKQDVFQIQKVARVNGLEVIPLIQTFGHLEFVLKHAMFQDLRENIEKEDSICPSEERSIRLIAQMIQQMRELHPYSEAIHIGADEAYHVAEDRRCKEMLASLGQNNRGVERLKLRHIARIAKLASSYNFTKVFAWNDMFDKSSIEDMKMEQLGKLIVPMVWGYAPNVLRENYFPPGLFERLVAVFPKIWFASAYKGANGANQTYINVERYSTNQRSYVRLYEHYTTILQDSVGGIVLTGWQRYKHRFPLCELLPTSIPSLVHNILYLNNVRLSQSRIDTMTMEVLNCTGKHQRRNLLPIPFRNYTYFPEKEMIYSSCQFYGSDVFNIIMKDLRFLHWKSNYLLPVDIPLFQEEIQSLKNRVLNIFPNYFFKRDVDEFLKQNIESLVSNF
ncbi:unnamed protein product [Auanema sp. JU1783]|nr:unnamed protein product [Auanema sp. JU1783]